MMEGVMAEARAFALCEYQPHPTMLDELWATMRRDGIDAAELDSLMAQPITRAVLRYASFAEALTHRLARKLADSDVPAPALAELIGDTFALSPGTLHAAAADLSAVRDRDPACPDLITPFLYFKGFQALQAFRISHVLWQDGRQHLARHLQARISEVFALDIHPAARLGCGIMIDHGTGVVIGETAVVEDNVSILQGVTLGGTGKACGDRHPKIRRGVLLGAGASVLGNIEVAEGAKGGAGSIVLEDVAAYTTVVGVPARPIGARLIGLPALTMDHRMPAPDYAI
jgi:serine O-acetyltransferase